MYIVYRLFFLFYRLYKKCKVCFTEATASVLIGGIDCNFASDNKGVFTNDA